MPDAPLLQRLRGLRRGLLAAAAIAAGLLMATAAGAQSDPTDPPARVGRISLISGPVTLVDYQADEESEARLNWPVTSQQRLITGRMGRVEVRIGSMSLRLDGDSVVDFNRVDDDLVQITLQLGTAAVRVRNREYLRELDILTPRERITLEDVGRYRIDVDRPAGITAVTAHVGAASIVNGRMSFSVQSGQRGEVTAEPQAGFQVVTPAPDVFDDWVASRDRRDDSIQSTRYVSAETTGVESLDDHGQWRTVESYGAVWFPTTVVAGWAPYRYGHWSYVAPWGWTWIDDASWGFTPFHYGRWVYIRDAWGWVPGTYVARPCYAPALVAWYGTPGIGVNVGWFPLAPHEAFIPSYRYTPRYITRVNYGPLGGVTVVNPPPTYRYRDPNFSTWAPSDAIVRREPIHRVVRQPPRDWARLPAQPTPPTRVTEDLRRLKPTLLNAAPPANRPGVVPPQRAVAPGANETRVEPPSRVPPTRETPGDHDRRRNADRGPDGRDVANRPPVPTPSPNAGHVNPPRAVAKPESPRVIETPRAVDSPRPERPRQEGPRFEQQPVPPVRQPKFVERAPMERTPDAGGRVAVPAQPVAQRPMPPAQRIEPPAQAVAPRPVPMPRQEAPVHQAPPVHAAPPAQRAPDAGAARGKPPQRVEPQRN